MKYNIHKAEYCNILMALTHDTAQKHRPDPLWTEMPTKFLNIRYHFTRRFH